MSKPSVYTPSRASAQKVAHKIVAAAETAGAKVTEVPEQGVFFTADQWAQFIVLLLDDAFRPKS